MVIHYNETTFTFIGMSLNLAALYFASSFHVIFFICLVISYITCVALDFSRVHIIVYDGPLPEIKTPRHSYVNFIHTSYGSLCQVYHENLKHENEKSNLENFIPMCKL